MEQRIPLDELVEPTLEGLGYTLVRVIVSGRNQPTLQVMAERKDGQPMALEDCETISRALSAKLDVEDPIAGSYTLEVSSPGIDRPLTRPADYRRFVGEMARVETKVPTVDGRRRFAGRIESADETGIRMAVDEGTVDIAYAEIAKGRLMVSDKPIVKPGKGAKHQQRNDRRERAGRGPNRNGGDGDGTGNRI
jgi:ribosome maturation factor RimP